MKPDMTHITSCRNVLSIKLAASDTSVILFWLVFPFRGRKNFKELNKSI